MHPPPLPEIHSQHLARRSPPPSPPSTVISPLSPRINPLSLSHSPSHPQPSPNYSRIRLPPSNLRRLHRTQFLRPSLRGLNLLHGAQLIGRISGDTDIVVALEDQLDVTEFQRG